MSDDVSTVVTYATLLSSKATKQNQNKSIVRCKMRINTRFHALKYTNDRVFLTYIIFCVLRVVLAFIQYGIIHPDEFFQSVEPMAGTSSVQFLLKMHFSELNSPCRRRIQLGGDPDMGIQVEFPHSQHHIPINPH